MKLIIIFHKFIVCYILVVAVGGVVNFLGAPYLEVMTVNVIVDIGDVGFIGGGPCCAQREPVFSAVVGVAFDIATIVIVGFGIFVVNSKNREGFVPVPIVVIVVAVLTPPCREEVMPAATAARL